MFSWKLTYKHIENNQILNGINNFNIFVVVCIPILEFNKTGSLSLITKNRISTGVDNFISICFFQSCLDTIFQKHSNYGYLMQRRV